ncbi:MAG: tRNA lysidine(34) synthetase TilS, partial [Arcobacter skirrowii]|nr:tRNA lysidine(34) synthetase TilS [Aliarcobacter skirrowii]
MNLDFSEIKSSKNLLAFSAGVDSTALFFLLLNSNIPFDIAIVDYNIRE